MFGVIRMRSTPRIVVPVVAAVFALALLGCGGDDNGDEAGGTTTVKETTARLLNDEEEEALFDQGARACRPEEGARDDEGDLESLAGRYGVGSAEPEAIAEGYADQEAAGTPYTTDENESAVKAALKAGCLDALKD
jgi:hypothetical protein